MMRKNSVAVTETSNSDVSTSNSSSVSPRIPSTPTSLAQSTTSSTSSTFYQELPQDTIMATIPMIRILGSQLQKTYFEWDKDTDSTVWTCKVENQEEDRTIEKLSLLGTTLYLDLSDQTKTSIPLLTEFGAESNVEFTEDTITFNDPSVVITCESNAILVSLQKMMALSYFEHTSVYKSLTGSLISSMGLRMPDINMILKSTFNFKDWCEIYVPGEGWVRSWCHINTMSKRTDKYEPKGKYQIKFYRDNKSNSPSAKANLICYIPDTSYVQDIFFYNPDSSVQPTVNNSADFLNNLRTIKLVGDVSYTQDVPSLRSPSTSSSITKQLISPKRDVSTKIVKESKSSSFRTEKKGLLIRPLAHRGLSHFDAMIKFIIPMMDITRKYGRPTQFIATTNNSKSLMFGLPKLPNTSYFKDAELEALMNERGMEYLEDKESLAYSITWISQYLSEIYELDPERC